MFDHVATSYGNDSPLPPGVEFVGHAPEFSNPAPEGDDPPRRDLNVLFPDWEKQMR